MTGFLIYILKSALLLAVFDAFFLLVMRRSGWFRFNRITLLAGSAACLLLPLIPVRVNRATLYSTWLEPVVVAAGDSAEPELFRAWAIDSSDANLAWTIAAVETEMYRSFEKAVKPWLDKAEAMVQPDSSFVSRIHQQYGTGYYKLDRFDKAIVHYEQAYRYNLSYIQALFTIGYCYERQKKYKQALEYYVRYLKLVRSGSSGYEFAKKSIEYVKGELFMNEP